MILLEVALVLLLTLEVGVPGWVKLDGEGWELPGPDWCDGGRWGGGGGARGILGRGMDGGMGVGGYPGSMLGCLSRCSGTGVASILMWGYLALWRSKWTLRFPLVENRFPQMLHLKGRSPVWERTWI